MPKEFDVTVFGRTHHLSFPDDVWTEHKAGRKKFNRRVQKVTDDSYCDFGDDKGSNVGFSLFQFGRVEMVGDFHNQYAVNTWVLPFLDLNRLDYKVKLWQHKADVEAAELDGCFRFWRSWQKEEARGSRIVEHFARLSSTLLDAWKVEQIKDQCLAAACVMRTLSQDADGNIRYWERWDDVGDPKRWRSMSVGKFLRKFRHKYKAQWTDKDIDWFAERLGMLHNDDQFTFKLVNGDKISRNYRLHYFGSCMSRSDAVEFYTHQPNVELLVIEDGSGECAGRALVWNTDQGFKFMDRVYPSDSGAHIEAAMDYAQSQGWEYKTEHCIDGDFSYEGNMSVTVKDCGHYPYMDTFASSSDEIDGEVVLYSHTGADHEWRSTDDECPWERGEWCNWMERSYPEYRMTYVPSVGEYVSDDALEDYFTLAYDDRYYESDYVVFCSNISAYMYEEHGDVVIDCITGDHLYIEHGGDVIEITQGQYKYEWTTSDNVVHIGDDVWWEEDPDLPTEDDEEDEEV